MCSGRAAREGRPGKGRVARSRVSHSDLTPSRKDRRRSYPPPPPPLLSCRVPSPRDGNRGGETTGKKMGRESCGTCTMSPREARCGRGCARRAPLACARCAAPRSHLRSCGFCVGCRCEGAKPPDVHSAALSQATVRWFYRRRERCGGDCPVTRRDAHLRVGAGGVGTRMCTSLHASQLSLRSRRVSSVTDFAAACNTASSWEAFGDIENEELEAAFSRGDDRVDFGAGR